MTRDQRRGLREAVVAGEEGVAEVLVVGVEDQGEGGEGAEEEEDQGEGDLQDNQMFKSSRIFFTVINVQKIGEKKRKKKKNVYIYFILYD